MVVSKTGFSKTGGIEVDKETGGLKGWTSIFSQIESEDAKKQLQAIEESMGDIIINRPEGQGKTYFKVRAH